MSADSLLASCRWRLRPTPRGLQPCCKRGGHSGSERAKPGSPTSGWLPGSLHRSSTLRALLGYHQATLTRDGQIRCGCWSGTLDGWRAMAAGDDWPSGCDEATRTRFRPRLEAWADLCEQQLAAWAAVQS